MSVEMASTIVALVWNVRLRTNGTANALHPRVGTLENRKLQRNHRLEPPQAIKPTALLDLRLYGQAIFFTPLQEWLLGRFSRVWSP